MEGVFVPGFTQTGTSWEPVLDIGVDPPGRGNVSLAIFRDTPTTDSFVDTAHALAQHRGSGTYVGYSQGGRLCLQLALDRPLGEAPGDGVLLACGAHLRTSPAPRAALIPRVSSRRTSSPR